MRKGIITKKNGKKKNFFRVELGVARNSDMGNKI